MQPCLFCGGDASEPAHRQRCDGRQGKIEAAAPSSSFNPREAFTLDPRQSRANRDAAVERVESNAPDGFMDEAVATIQRTAMELPEFIVDEVWRRMTSQPPPEARAMGPAMTHAKRLGYIRPTGRFRATAQPRSHAQPRRIWESMICRSQTIGERGTSGDGR